jgi:2-amino-4-hydroxy-6-hydroxymethyldihydropteridine diphosphokinase
VESQLFIALGSNMGDRELHLLLAVAEIGKITGTRITALSGFYETTPVGGPPQPDFINAVMQCATLLNPMDILTELQRIEREVFRRERTVRWGARTMDLDILFYGSLSMADDDLVIPHPRLHERRFVLQPLAEIAPDFIHPLLNRNIADLLLSVVGDERVTRIQEK